MWPQPFITICSLLSQYTQQPNPLHCCGHNKRLPFRHHTLSPRSLFVHTCLGGKATPGGDLSVRRSFSGSNEYPKKQPYAGGAPGFGRLVWSPRFAFGVSLRFRLHTMALGMDNFVYHDIPNACTATYPNLISIAWRRWHPRHSTVIALSHHSVHNTQSQMSVHRSSRPAPLSPPAHPS